MSLDLKTELIRLQKKTIPELLSEYGNVFGQPAASRHKQHLIRRIAWGMQAAGSTPLSDRAQRRVSELVDPSDLRVRSATNTPSVPLRLHRSPIPGTVICREYKGELLQVRVLDDGFEFNGREFGSLSAVAKHITGSHWNGNLFFGIQSSSRKQRSHA